MNVSFEDIGHLAVTFAAEGCEAGQVCRLTDSGTVGPCAEGDSFCGVVEGLRKGFAAVQVEGFARVGFTAPAPAVGYGSLCADGNGGVKTGSGREYLVVSVDASAQTAIIKL